MELSATTSTPLVVVLSGPNGAGKSTSAAKLLKGPLQVAHFVNADTIAQGLSAFDQQQVALQAGRIMLRRIRELASTRSNFAFETTLATRSYAPWLRNLQREGYRVHLVFLWLPSPEMAVARVADRVRAGGHAVPEDIIVRRYAAGLANLTSLYIPLADSWQVVDNTKSRFPRVVSTGAGGQPPIVSDDSVWKTIVEGKRGV